LRLSGILPFDRIDLDLTHVEELARRHFQPLLVNVKDLTRANEMEIRVGETSSREEVERLVIQDLVERDARRRPHSEQWTELILGLKRMADTNSPPDEIISQLTEFHEETREDTSC
jgi:predicted membrane chloride channel (bestrophin family)